MWLLGFQDRGKIDEATSEKTAYKNSYANAAFRTLNTMLAEAVRQNLISCNPCNNVKRLKNNRKEIRILTLDEVQRLFPKKYETIWGDKIIPYAANRLASITGMRIGEIIGFKGEFMFDQYIYVCGQYGSLGYENHTKTKENRSIPIASSMMGILLELKKVNGNGYLFSLDGGATPVCANYIAQELNKALNKIGITKDEKKQRGLTLHSWRHFLNTDLQRQGLTIPQVQGVTGQTVSKAQADNKRYAQ